MNTQQKTLIAKSDWVCDDNWSFTLPATNSSTSEQEIDHIHSWMWSIWSMWSNNNLQLNSTKSKEIVFFAQRGRFNTAQRQPLCKGIEQVDSVTALGVTFNSRFAVSEHITKVLSSCSGLLYALGILRTHGMPAISLYDVFRATIVANLLYCSPAWSGFCSAADISRLDAFLKRCKRFCYCPNNFPTVSELFSDADHQLFSRISHIQHMFSSHCCQPTLNTPIICERNCLLLITIR